MTSETHSSTLTSTVNKGGNSSISTEVLRPSQRTEVTVSELAELSAGQCQI